MSALRDTMTHAALGWVKPELDEILRQVRGEIEAFVEEPNDTGRMGFCARYLHQVQATLRMVELYASAMVAEELELLAVAVQNGHTLDRDEACATLMRGTVLLPDYLERLRDGHRDIPIVLLPLLNEIRTLRGESGLGESALLALSPDASTASQAELDHARGSISGRNRELLDTVGTAVKEELLRVKDALDLHLRTGADIAALQAQVAELASVADTLGVMGLEVARSVVVQQRDALRSIVDGERQADEALLLDIAGALLYVDASLDDQVAYLGASVDVHDDASAAEARRTLEALAQEAIANFGNAREHVVAFIETNWDHERLVEVPRLLAEVAGALRMLQLPRPADYLEGVRRYVAIELIGKRRVPSGRQLDTLADAMASLEYYLEALRARRPRREEILDIAHSSLEALRYWPLPSVVSTPQGESTPSPEQTVVEAVTPPSISAWNLAPVVDTTVPEIPSSVPQWTLDAANGQADIDSDVDSGSGVVEGVTLMMTPADSVDGSSEALRFDPVAAEQEAWNGTSEPLHIDLETLELEHAAFRPQATPSAARADGLSLPPVVGFDPAAAEYAEPPVYTPDPDLGEQDDPSLVIVQTPVAMSVATDPSEDTLTIELDDALAFADVPMVATDEAYGLDWHEASQPPVIDTEAGAQRISGDNAHANADADDAVPASPHTVALDADEPDKVAAAALVDAEIALAQFDLVTANTLATRGTDTAPPAGTAAEAGSAGQYASAAAATTVDAGFIQADDAIDDDIRAVFLEEFDEELVNLGQLLPAWRAAPSYMDSLRPIRRVFHTLKGSGRLVGACVLAEFSWKIESMLNRVLDGARPVSPAVVAMVEQAYALLPQFNAALRGDGVLHADLDALQAVIERIAAGEEAYYVVASPATADAPRVGTPASVDSVLLEILDAEVATHLETIHAWLQAAPQPATEALLRAVHTMSGAFAMTEVPEITAVTGPAESYVKRALAAGIVVDAEGVRALADAGDAIAATIEELQAPSPLIPRFTELAQRLQALVDTLPQVQWPTIADDEDEDAPSAQHEDGLDPQSLPVVEFTAADDLSTFLDDTAHLPDAARVADTVAHDCSGVAEADAAPSAQLQHTVDVAHAHANQSEQDAHVASSMPQGDDASVAAVMAGARGEDILPVATVPDIAAMPAGREAGDQTVLVQDDQLHEPTVAMPLTAGEDQVTVSLAVVAEMETALENAADADTPQPGLSDVAPAELSATDLGPLDFSDLDRELVDIFVEEGKDLLDHCDRLVAELRAAPQDRDLLGGLQRDLHTLKGGARMAGINAIGDLGHGIESLLEAVAANRTELDRRDVQSLERGFDRLHQLLTLTGNHRAVAKPVDLIDAFAARTRAYGVMRASEADYSVAEADHAAEPATSTGSQTWSASVAPAALSAPLPLEGALENEATIARPMQEQVRVSADLLDRLVNQAGEVAIYRSRLEQQLGAFRGAMGELERTNARLRDQLRRLDLETEAQIVARYQREQDQTQQNFDPLELDRFSTLQQLSRALNESAADLGGLQSVLDDLARQYDSLLQQQARVSSELQDGLMRARMVPFDGLVPRLRRVVRQAASETGKHVHLSLDGTHGELDRNVLDRMVAPLEHMLRNSVAHGLEMPEQRLVAGKSEDGEIAIRLRREGSEIVLEVADDGAGLDREAIRRRAEQRGLIAAEAVLSDAQLDALIFAPGFSTYDQVSQLAGRGVGMDVVCNEVRQLGGSVDIHSVRGQGVTFTLRLPQTLAVTQAVFVQIGDTTFAVPVASVSGIGRIGRERFEAAHGGYRYSGEEYTLYDLGSLLGQAPARAEGLAQVPLLLVRAGDLRAAVAIDQVLGNREIVVKPVGLQIASVPGIYGATIAGDGRVVVILDIAPLVRRYLAQPLWPSVQTAPTAQRRMPLVMVVDDSLTMRKVTGRVLERHNFDVVSARDGVEALELMEERVPDLMLLDIEMPRMDGYELAAAMRADPRYAAIPIVMITSRSGEKHRQRAFELGVQRYLGKPYQELDLMRNVYDLLGIARVRD
ncbi:Hpt domain-containing protein [Xanthomonas albilineans]|uniref:Chemotaxis protein CheA n=1 Tax=Xanthomonas albilineans (strain GPE PC73 / CFBP 7063) TaxID=380358 RepID=D2UEX4_XANAP|nr:Hpt domain-containing protein [Xanthomonas albilineans]QHQ28967.1 putative two-component system sensor histidine kinase-response regulator hybrid protein pill [Xanthomonas albilineans]CBA16720.1 probable two-component system sensor histidine kinase-response regulator hybrid protein pill [Xanthomonas albilineans GPE PC73]